MSAPEKPMSKREAMASGGSGLGHLAELAGYLAEAIVGGDVMSAREAHSAIGRELESASEQPGAVVDLARERERRATQRRNGT